MSAKPQTKHSAFSELGFEPTIDTLIKQTQELYLSDDIPWVLGYSGGKDSTATLQLIWAAIAALPEDKHIKPIHVISTDTMVENPVVALWVNHSLKAMQKAVDEQSVPIHPHRLAPTLADRFWVNSIGKGYPAPRPKFRWCTSRLKINPSNAFIQNLANQNKEAILILGTRKAESSARSKSMDKYEKGSTRKLLSRNGDMERVWVYTPISSWSNDDVWQYLVQRKNPWGYNNKDLLGMYQGATEDGECPLVVDTSTPSCGDSRFGCFVCTMVSEDKSMTAMIQNDEEKEWMLPLLNFRNKWLTTDDRDKRDFRKMNGSLLIHNDRLVHGPYKQEYRVSMLKALLQAQIDMKDMMPEEISDFDLISIDELKEIRRIWISEKHETEDLLPRLYKEVTGDEFPDNQSQPNQLFSIEDLQLLRDVCSEEGDDEGINYQLVRELLHIEQQYQTMVKRSGLLNHLDKAIERHAFDQAAQAEEFALHKRNAKKDMTDRTTDHSEYIQQQEAV